MAIVNGQVILSGDLASIWQPVQTVYAVRGENRDSNQIAFQFDGLYQDQLISNPYAGVRLLIPSVDTELVAIVVTTQNSGGEDIPFKITGSINQPITATIVGTPLTSRHQIAVPPGRFGLLAGSTVRVEVNAAQIVNPIYFHVQFVTVTAWSKE